MERIPEEVIKAYESSDSYQKLKALQDESGEILLGYYRKYKDKLPYFKEEVIKKLDHERYGTGMALPRGRLCPGNMEALIIGGVKRGRMVKEYINPGYVYGYDKEDNLITSDKVSGDIKDREYIFWKDPCTQVGLQYDELLGLEYGEITEACYNEQGKIISFISGELYHEEISTIIVEKYKYEGDKAFVTLIGCFTGDDGYIIGEHIILHMDEKGKVLKYTGYTDMNLEEVYEGVPKYKLVL